MASTNTNTSIETISTSENILSTDIYEISEFIEGVRDNTIDDLSETSSIVGIFGYMNEMFSQSLQNTLIVVSETSNETISTRAKFKKNVITHSMNLGITKIDSGEKYAENSVFSMECFYAKGHRTSIYISWYGI